MTPNNILIERPLLVGEDNPHSGDPRAALFPAPDGTAGHRLAVKVFGLSRGDYLSRFYRANLCAGKWGAAEARATARGIVAASQQRARVIVLLGRKVAEAFELEYAPFSRTIALGYNLVIMLPHPSGRCRAWNDPDSYASARAAMGELLL